jgi:hypothetical protein
VISVLLPTRERPELLRRSIESLRNLAAGPVEILCAVDRDDDASVARELADSTWFFPRYGYGQLHRYCDELAKHAAGTWLLLWNDDAVMRTEGWNLHVMEQPDSMVLRPFTNHGGGLNPFPFIPRRWYTTLGHISMSPHIDTWWEEINKRIHGTVGETVAVEVFHDRHDLTGNNNDATFQARVLEGRKFHTNPDYKTQLDRDAERIRTALVP